MDSGSRSQGKDEMISMDSLDESAVSVVDSSLGSSTVLCRLPSDDLVPTRPPHLSVQSESVVQKFL